ALLVMTLEPEVGLQPAPDLSVPVDAGPADSGAGEERSEPSHRQRRLVDVVAEGERRIADVLEQVMAPHVAQLVLVEGCRPIVRGRPRRCTLEREDGQSRVAQLLGKDRAGPAEADQNDI